MDRAPSVVRKIKAVDSRCRRMFYRPNSDVRKAVISIDGELFSPPVHVVTVSKSTGCTPRHRFTADMAEAINPVMVGPDDGAEVFHVEFASGAVCTVIYANGTSNLVFVRNIYDVWRSSRRLFLQIFLACPNAICMLTIWVVGGIWRMGSARFHPGREAVPIGSGNYKFRSCERQQWRQKCRGSGRLLGRSWARLRARYLC